VSTDLQHILQKAGGPTEKLSLQMKMLWVSDHAYKQFKLTRLHLIDATSPEPLEDLLTVRRLVSNVWSRRYDFNLCFVDVVMQLFRDKYDENRDAVDSVLLTATMWDMGSDSKKLPPPGQVITISDYSGLKLFREDHCQVTVKLRDLSWERGDP